MAKLYFRHGAMGSSKTANALMVEYNYYERGKDGHRGGDDTGIDGGGYTQTDGKAALVECQSEQTGKTEAEDIFCSCHKLDSMLEEYSLYHMAHTAISANYCFHISLYNW